MNNLFTIPKAYSAEYIQTTKCKPLIDLHQERLMADIVGKQLSYDDFTFLDKEYLVADASPELVRPIFANFKKEFQRHLEQSTLNKIVGFDSFARTDIVLGCTQYIDDLHIKHDIQVLEDEYIYHQKLNSSVGYKTLDTLDPNKHLVISMPFSHIGRTHPQMQEILDTCLARGIDVHLDGAWLTAAKNVNIDLSHPAIRSFAVSMSKGYGLSGWNRIGLRWTKDPVEDSISVMNDYIQINTYSVVIGNYFLKHTEPDHLWNTHGDNHFKICNDFGLNTSDTIHMATKDGSVLGIAPLLKYLESNV
jgi:hypothetical protein